MMKRMYVTQFPHAGSMNYINYVKGVMDGFFYPDKVYLFGDIWFIGVTTTSEMYEFFKEAIPEILGLGPEDKDSIKFDIFGGTYE